MCVYLSNPSQTKIVEFGDMVPWVSSHRFLKRVDDRSSLGCLIIPMWGNHGYVKVNVGVQPQRKTKKERSKRKAGER